VSIIGIDPGVSGGMAFSIVGKHIETFPFEKATEADVVDWIKYREYDGTHAFIERVSSSPQMGVVSAFTFGKPSWGQQRPAQDWHDGNGGLDQDHQSVEPHSSATDPC
jgi:hypothetical protein